MWLRSRSRIVLFYLVLLLGNCSGVAMRPKDIEESLHAYNQTIVEEANQNGEDDEDENKSLVVSEGETR